MRVITYQFKLYVSGKGEELKKTIENMTETLEVRIKGRYSLEVIDILKTPQLEDEHNIFAAPTLVRIAPKPVTKIMGDLSYLQKALPELIVESW